MARTSGPIRAEASNDDAAERIKLRRKEFGMSQQALAEATDVSRQTIISMEQGNYAPSVYLALRVAEALHTQVEDLWS